MPPARTFMKPDTLVARSASHQGRSAHKNIDDDANEDFQTCCLGMSKEPEDDEFSPSQGTAVQNLIIGSLSNQKRRHVVNKNKIKENYSSAKIGLQNRIATFFDAHEDQSDAAHSAQLKRLAELLATKSTIESQMAAKLAHLRALYDAHSKELTSVVGARVKELKQVDTFGGGLES